MAELVNENAFQKHNKNSPFPDVQGMGFDFLG